MVRIHAAALLWAWAQISSGGNGVSAASDTRGLLTLLCTHEHDASRTSLAHIRLPLFTGVRGIGILRSSPERCSRKHQLCLATPHVGKETLQIRDAGRYPLH